MASALIHMSCTQLNYEREIGMESSSYGDIAGLEKAKRELDLYDLEQSQVKKRRKQSKPIRIASSESLSDGENKLPTWRGVESNETSSAPEPFLVEDSLTSQDALESEPMNNVDFLHEVPFESKMASGGPANNYIVKTTSDPSFPLNLSVPKNPSPKAMIPEELCIKTEDKNGFKSKSPQVYQQLPSPAEPMNMKYQVFQNNMMMPTQSASLILPNFKRILMGNNENNLTSPHRIFNPEAFCDLCNKEFCNKYFLKTHKANKHGIYMENVGTTTAEPLPNIPMITYFSTNYNQNSLPTAPPPPPPPPPKRSTSASGTTTPAKQNSSSMRAFCNICQREFCNKYFVRRHKAKIHGIIENAGETQEYKPQMFSVKSEISNDSSTPGPSSLKPLNQPPKEGDNLKVKIKSEMDVEAEESGPQNALNLLVSTWQNEEGKETSTSPERNKKGVSTPQSSAFCEICCKEYYNKYFLRIHKQKCHGIALNDKEEKVNGNYNFWPPNQPMPLNLILREGSEDVPELEENIACTLCNANFPSIHLLKHHYEQNHTRKAMEVNSSQKPFYSPQETSDVNLKIEIQRPVENHLETNENTEPQQGVKQGTQLTVKVNPSQEGTVCEICNKDFGQAVALENHLLRDHPALFEDMVGSFEEDPNERALIRGGPVKYDCSKCQKSFQNYSLLEQHLSSQHNIFESKLNFKNGNETPDLNLPLALSTDRQNLNTPTSSFCDICKKELCNKYFMKTHMQRMHGISIENGAHIGGVVCDICNKELCSKYFLRVHKQNSHGIVEEAFLPQLNNDFKSQINSIDTSLRPSENELNNRYFSHFTEVCSICSRRFRSAKWLKAHLLNDHGEEGKDKWREVQMQNGAKGHEKVGETPKKSDIFSNFKVAPEREIESRPGTSDLKESPSGEKSNELLPSLLSAGTIGKKHQCSYCSFSTPVLTLLFVHERSHISSNFNDSRGYRCPNCISVFDTLDSLEKHISTHKSSPVCKPVLEETSLFGDAVKPMSEPKEPATRDATVPNDEGDNVDLITSQSKQVNDKVCLKCNRCSYMTNELEVYTDHIIKEHKIDEPNANYLQVIKDALLHLACNSLIPASFAVPNDLGNFMMQPFLLEDKAMGSDSQGAFLSSLVFLPVKERLNQPITASFKLTPT